MAIVIISFRSAYSLDFSAKVFLSISPEDSSFSNKACLLIKSLTVFGYHFKLSNSDAFFSTSLTTLSIILLVKTFFRLNSRQIKHVISIYISYSNICEGCFSGPLTTQPITDKVIGVFICESFFNIFTVSITSKPCLAHEGQKLF